MIEINGLLFIGIAVALGFLLGKTTHWVKLTAIVGYIIAGILLGLVSLFAGTVLLMGGIIDHIYLTQYLLPTGLES